MNRETALERIAKGMPIYPTGVVVLTRLAIDIRFQGRELAAALLQDAFGRVERAADIVGVRALFVHAINDSAREFYMHQGFVPSPIEPVHLMLAMKDFAGNFEGAEGLKMRRMRRLFARRVLSAVGGASVSILLVTKTLQGPAKRIRDTVRHPPMRSPFEHPVIDQRIEFARS